MLKYGNCISFECIATYPGNVTKSYVGFAVCYNHSLPTPKPTDPTPKPTTDNGMHLSFEQHMNVCNVSKTCQAETISQRLMTLIKWKFRNILLTNFFGFSRIEGIDNCMGDSVNSLGMSGAHFPHCHRYQVL